MTPEGAAAKGSWAGAGTSKRAEIPAAGAAAEIAPDFVARSLVGFLVVSSCFYALAYFFPFVDRRVIAPDYVRWIKEFVWGGVLLFGVRAWFRRRPPLASLWSSWPRRLTTQFMVVYGVLLVCHALHLFSERFVIVYAKNFLVYSPALLLAGILADNPLALSRAVGKTLVGLGTVQVVVGFAVMAFFPGAAFWRDDPTTGFHPLVGFLGNPNRFGLFLNVGAAWLLVESLAARVFWRGAAAAAGLSVFAVAVAYTGAVSQLVVTLGLLAYGAFVARFALGTRWPRILAVVGLTLAALGLFAGPFLLKVPVVEDALRFFSIGTHAPAPFCTAIGNRLRQFYWIRNYALNASGPSLLFGSFSSRGVFLLDSEWSDVFLNWGLVGMASLLSMVAGLGWGSVRAARTSTWSLERRWVSAAHHLALAVFGATFLIDSGLYDFPTSFLLFLVAGLLAALLTEAPDIRAAATVPAGPRPGRGERGEPSPDGPAAGPYPASPVVSIVTPAYNAAAYIDETIASVQSQTFADWEMWVVDDCSKDDTAARVAARAARDPRVRLIRQPRNGGPALARDAAVRAARGRYVAFLDSDDTWAPVKLEKQLAFMASRDAAVSFTSFRRINRDGSRVGDPVAIPPRLNYRQLLSNTALATSTVIVDRARTGTFRMTPTYYDDFALWLDLLKRGVDAHGLSEDLMRYRVVGKSVSRNKFRSALWVWRTYRGVERLSWIDAAVCFAQYALRALWKYRRF